MLYFLTLFTSLLSFYLFFFAFLSLFLPSFGLSLNVFFFWHFCLLSMLYITPCFHIESLVFFCIYSFLAPDIDSFEPGCQLF